MFREVLTLFLARRCSETVSDVFNSVLGGHLLFSAGRRNKAEATDEAEDDDDVGGPLPDFDPPAWLGVLPDPLAVDTDDYAESLGARSRRFWFLVSSSRERRSSRACLDFHETVLYYS